jgi:hypothetical protein
MVWGNSVHELCRSRVCCCTGLGCEDALMHLLNLVWPNIFEISPHVVQAVTGAINGCRLALGPAVILSYLLQGLWHPARSVFRSALSYGQGLHPRAAGHAFSVHL